MSLTKQLLEALALNDTFAVEGEEIRDSSLVRRQRDLWRGLVQHPQTAGDRELLAICRLIADETEKNEIQDEAEVPLRIVKLLAPFVKDEEKFRNLFASNRTNCIAIGLAFCSDFATVPGKGIDENFGVLAVTLKAVGYRMLLADDHPVKKALNRLAEEYNATNNSFRSFFNDAKSRTSELEGIYADKLKLEEPSKYFSLKARTHRTVAMWSGSLSVILLVSFLVIVGTIGRDVLNNYSDKITAQNVYIYGLAAVSTVGALAWIVRILNKIFLQNLALLADARHREVLIKLFLAIQLEAGSRPDERERILILNALFRGLGDSKEEDVAPPSLLDLIQKSKTNS